MILFIPTTLYKTYILSITCFVFLLTYYSSYIIHYIIIIVPICSIIFIIINNKYKFTLRHPFRAINLTLLIKLYSIIMLLISWLYIFFKHNLNLHQQELLIANYYKNHNIFHIICFIISIYILCSSNYIALSNYYNNLKINQYNISLARYLVNHSFKNKYIFLEAIVFATLRISKLIIFNIPITLMIHNFVKYTTFLSKEFMLLYSMLLLMLLILLKNNINFKKYNSISTHITFNKILLIYIISNILILLACDFSMIYQYSLINKLLNTLSNINNHEYIIDSYRIKIIFICIITLFSFFSTFVASSYLLPMYNNIEVAINSALALLISIVTVLSINYYHIYNIPGVIIIINFLLLCTILYTQKGLYKKLLLDNWLIPQLNVDKIMHPSFKIIFSKKIYVILTNMTSMLLLGSLYINNTWYWLILLGFISNIFIMLMLWFHLLGFSRLFFNLRSSAVS